MSEALIELARVHPRLFQTVDSETIDVSNHNLSGRRVLERFSDETVDPGADEVREEMRLRHLFEARFVHFLLTSEGRAFLEALLRQQLEDAALLDT